MWGLVMGTNHYRFSSDVTFSSACRHVLDDHRTILDTGTASGTAIFDDGAGALSDLDLEVSGRTFHALKVCIGDELDI